MSKINRNYYCLVIIMSKNHGNYFGFWHDDHQTLVITIVFWHDDHQILGVPIVPAGVIFARPGSFWFWMLLMMMMMMLGLQIRQKRAVELIIITCGSKLPGRGAVREGKIIINDSKSYWWGTKVCKQTKTLGIARDRGRWSTSLGIHNGLRMMIESP